MKTLSIIIPVFNEKETLLGLLQSVEQSSIGDLSKEIILIDDYSSDGTRELLKELQKSNKYKIFFHEKNKGKGFALRTGFANATGDYVLIQDADLEYNPKEYSNLLGPLLDGEADVVYGSRFVRNKPHGVLFFWHYVGNKLLTVLSNMLTGLYLTDMETCYKVFTKDALRKICSDLRSNRFDIEPEITALVAHYKLRVYEVGISYSSRTYDEGKKINWKDAFSAVWTMIKSKYRFSSFGLDPYKALFFCILVFLSMFSVFALKPAIAGDSLLYVDSIQVIKTHVEPQGFMPMMIVSTYLGLRLIMLFSAITGSMATGWLLLDMILYCIAGVFFYSLLKRMFEDAKVAFWGSLFLFTNYAAVVFGLGYLMDMGGWTAYIASLYFTYRYLEATSRPNKWMYISAVVIGIGGLYKEYAFVAYVVLFGSLVWREWSNWKKIFRGAFITGVFAFFPFFLMNVYTFIQYHGYTYLDWFRFQKVYEYQNRPLEFIKSFGSIYNFGWFIFFPGFYLLVDKAEEMFKDRKLVFMWLSLVSCLSVLLWPVVTRVLFITMPAVMMVTCLFFERVKKYSYMIYSILFIYVICSFLMDAYILNFVSITSVFTFLQ